MSAYSEGNPQRDAIIEFRDAAYRLENGQLLLSRINLTVRQGETLVLLGRSGAGKTTALKLINRLLDPTEGEVRVEDRRTTEWNPIDLRRHVGYVIQETGLFPALYRRTEYFHCSSPGTVAAPNALAPVRANCWL